MNFGLSLRMKDLASLPLRGMADGLLELAADLGETTYVGPCVCDVCPCPLILNHRSGEAHCWLCAKGDHWVPPS